MRLLNFITPLLLVFQLTSCVNENSNKKKNSSKKSTQVNSFRDLQGVLDTSFGNNGVVLQDNAAFGGINQLDSGDVIKVTSSGDIIVCGRSSNGSNDDIVIWKFSPNGIIDENFGSGGIFKRHNIAGGNSNETCNDIILNEDGSFYLTGESYNSNNDLDLYIYKIKSNGSPDYSFGFLGYIYYDYSTGNPANDSSTSIFKNDQGELLLVGNSVIDNKDILMWRFFSTGSRDTTFGTDGNLNIDTLANLTNSTLLGDSKVLSNGKVIILGFDFITNQSLLLRLNANATLDNYFTINDNTAYKSICHASNNHTIYASYQEGFDTKVYKINSDGNLDSTFGVDGVLAVPNVSNINDLNYKLKCLQNDQGDLFIITTHNGVTSIYKYMQNGEIDTSYGENGVFSLSLSIDVDDKTLDASFAKDGPILITGIASISGEEQMFVIKVK